MKKKLFVLSGMFFAFAPVVAFAQNNIPTGGDCGLSGGNGNLFGLMCRVLQLLNYVVPVLIALGVVYFVWGVVSYVISDDEEAKAKGRDRIIFGIIGLAVIVGLWGLVSILKNTFFLNNNQNYTLPTIPPIANP